MKNLIQHIAYESGLYAQGTPDSWDEEHLELFAHKLLDKVVERLNQREVRTWQINYLGGWQAARDSIKTILDDE